MGNVLGIADAAQEDLYFDDPRVSAAQTCTNDSLYRLVQATGRERVGKAQTTFGPSASGGLPDSGDPALRPHTQTTTCDATGTITQMHRKSVTASVSESLSFERSSPGLACAPRPPPSCWAPQGRGAGGGCGGASQRA